MAASPRSPRRRLTPLQIVLALAGVVVVIVAEALLVRAYQAIDTASGSVETSGQLIGDIADLQRQAAQLDRLTDAALDDPGATFAEADARRSQLTAGVNTMAAQSADNQPVMDSLGEIKNTLSQYDAFLATARALPASQRAAARLEVGLILDGLAQQTNALFDREQRLYLQTLRDNLAAQRANQSTLIVMSLLLLTLGVGFVLSVGRSVRTEIDRSAGRLQVAADVGRAASSLLSPDELFNTTLELIRSRFGYYHAAIYLLNSAGTAAVLRAAAGESGQALLAQNWQLPVGSHTVVGEVTAKNAARVIADTLAGNAPVRAPRPRPDPMLPATRSQLAVPLRQGGQVIGALDVQSTKPNAFADADVAVFQTLADQLAVAIGNAAQYSGEQARARKLAALSEATLEITGPQVSLDVLYNLIVRQAAKLFNADDAGLWLPTDKKTVELKANVALPQLTGRGVPMGADVPGQAYSLGRTFRVDDYTAWPDRTEALADAPIHSALAAPLAWQGSVVGVLVLVNTGPERPFSADDERLAPLFASQIAASIENTNLLDETQSRFGELYTLNRLAQVAASQTSLPSLFASVRQEVAASVNARSMYIALYDEARGEMELPYVWEDDKTFSLPPIPLGAGLTGVVIRARQPLLINTAQEADALQPLTVGKKAESFLAVPIIVGEAVLGVLAVQDPERQFHFSDSDARLLTIVAAQIGLAIQNVRLLEQSRRRAEELAAVNRVTTAAGSTLDLNAKLQAISRELVHVFNTRNTGIALLNPAGTDLVVVADYSVKDEPSARGVVIPLANNLSSQRVIETRRPLIIADPQNDPLTAPIHDLMRRRNTQGLLIVPLISRDEVIGTIGIDSNTKERRFTDADAELAVTIAAQISSAVETSQLYEHIQRRAGQLAVAAEVSRAAISATDPDELIVRSVELIRDRFDLYYAALFLVDDETRWAVLQHATGDAGSELLRRGHKLEIGGQSMVGSAVATRRARIAPDAGREAVRFANPLLPDTHSEIALPLVVGDTVLGALDAQSTETNAFSDADITTLQTMADQIAIALQNARLLEQTQAALGDARRLANRERRIAEVTGRITQATSIQRILQVTADELRRATGSSRASIHILPPASDDE